MFREIILPIFRSTRLCVTSCGIMHPLCCRSVGWKRRNVIVIQVYWQLVSRNKCSCSQAVNKAVWHIPFLRYQHTGRQHRGCIIRATSCNTQTSDPEDGRDHLPKHVELIEIINKPLFLHQIGVYIIYVNDVRSNKYQICALHMQEFVLRAIYLQLICEKSAWLLTL